MTKVNSTPSRRARKPIKPKKPHKDFPLFPHATRRWAKKIRGKLWYFGAWEDPQGALERWLAQKDDLLAGRIPRDRVSKTGVTLRELCNKFLTTKTLKVESGELSPHSFRDYHATCARLIDALGAGRLLIDIEPEDFEKLRAAMAKTWGKVRLGNKINEARVVFNYAYKNKLLDRPMVYGDGFSRPSKKTLRQERQRKDKKRFAAEELRTMIDGASQPLKSMLMLAINAGLGNEDVGRLPMKALDLEGGWLDYPRPKTAIVRRCPLWPETVACIKEWLSTRPTPKSEADATLVFVTAKGGSWAKSTTDNPVSKETRKLLNRLSLNGHRNFYAIRHTFSTESGGAKDPLATDFLMGHANETIREAYDEGIADDRLVAVVNFVRRWLFGS
jgi:integrase